MSKSLKHKNGRELNDREFCLVANSILDKEFDKNKKYPMGMSGEFIMFMREWREHINNGGDAVEYKKSHIIQTVPYDLLIENTNKRGKYGNNT